MKHADRVARTALCWVLPFVLPIAMAHPAEVTGLEPCSAPEYRQFDFWIGDWDVVAQPVNPSRPAAHNRISSTQGGCVILEEYATPGGYTGVSISYYDARDAKWYQAWMDNQGSPIIHSGGLSEGSMILVDDSDAKSIARTTWTSREDGSVRQHWESSTDGGQTWNTVFDGIYTRRD